MAKEVPVPKELEILLPDMVKAVIVVGQKAYEMLPLYEGQLERISSEIADIMEQINSPDGKCPKCGKVVKQALPLKIYKCPDDGESLMTMNKAAMEAIVSSGKIPAWVETISGVPAEDVKAHMTLNQMKHFAGLFWKINFSDEGLPEVSKENFQKLLGMVTGTVKKADAPTATTTPEIEKT